MGVNPVDSASTSSSISRYHVHGITSSISNAEPTSEDLKMTGELEVCLRLYGLFEDESELAHRVDVLQRINTLVKNWIKEVTLEKVSALELFLSDIFMILFVLELSI